MYSAEQLCLSLLSSCKTLRSLQQLQALSTKSALDADPLVAGKLLLHCAVHLSDALDYARRLLHHTPNPDAFMYNSLIRGFSDSNTPQNSISTLSLMLRNLGNSQIDSFTLAFSLKSAATMRCFRTGSHLHCQAMLRGFHTHIFVGTTLISMYAECACADFALKVFDEIPQPNIVTWNALLTALFRSGDVGGAKRVFDLMPAKGLQSYNLMLGGYTKLREFALARKVFEEMPIKDETSWSNMVLGFAQNGSFGEAFGYFRRLHELGMRPNEVSLTGVLSACAQAGELQFGMIMHGYIEKAGHVWRIPVNNALMDMYSKCGSVDMARLVFRRMPIKSIISWTTLIAGLAMQGYGEEGVALFYEMEESGLIPDGTVFVALLYACSHAGLVEKGSVIFEEMAKVYGIEPKIEHYGCMVDLYSRAGDLMKAYDFITKMPIPPNDIIWRTLLGACSFHGNVQLAEEVKTRLSELDAGDHVLLSNIYAVAGKWKDVVKVRRSMAELKLSKTPGWSLIKVDNVMYTFVAGVREDDDDDSVTREAYKNLNEIMVRLKVEGGYVPEVVNALHDVEEEEKEGAVVVHSEKMAVAFGMARLGEEAREVRIVKNLRVCQDCHNVMKLISKVYKLEIILRDRSRFHSFKNGTCSCRDYW